MLERLHKLAFDLFFVSAMPFCLSLFWKTEDGDFSILSQILGFAAISSLAILLLLTMAKMLREEDQDSA